jgi:hypothetical protein
VNTTATDVRSGLHVESLRDRLTGRVILPADAEYDEMRLVTRGDIDGHPAVIVRVASNEDVALAIAFARQNGLEIAVRSGGHSSAGQSTVDDGLVIDVRDMRDLQIDTESQTAWAQTGLAAADLTKAAWEHKLVIGFGDTGSVGIGGITLGGGVGYLSRLHGLTIDNVLAAEIVTADGQILLVDERNHPDLFWALRGGGGNFGVVTRFKYRLHPVDTFVGGMLFQPATAETVSGFIKAAHDAPDEVGTILNIMNAPPMPFLSEDVVGKLICFGMLGHVGTEHDGIEAMKPFQALAEPYSDFLKPMPYPDMYPPEDPSYRPKAIDHVFFMESVDEQTAQTIIDRLNASDATLRAMQLRVLGGAIARVPSDATAYAHRDRKIMAIAVSFFEGPDDLPRRQQWLEETVEALDQGVPGAYVNFVRGEDDASARTAYPDGTYKRLAAVKAKYDPENVFHRNVNVPPSRA